MKKIIFFAFYLGLCAVAQATVIKIVVPYSPGGITDQSAQLIKQVLTDQTSYTYRIEYITGAGGQLAARNVANQRQSETILLVHSAAVLANAVSHDAAYRIQDFIPVTKIGAIQTVLVTHAESQVNNIYSLLLNQRPIFYATAGYRTAMHFAGEQLGKSTNQTLTPVHLRGESAALVEILGKRIEIMFASWSLIKHHTNIAVLAVTGSTRNNAIPNVPTLAELNIKGFDTSPNWSIVLANPGADQKILAEIYQVLSAADIDAFTQIGIDAVFHDPAYTQKFLIQESIRLSTNLK